MNSVIHFPLWMVGFVALAGCASVPTSKPASLGKPEFHISIGAWTVASEGRERAYVDVKQPSPNVQKEFLQEIESDAIQVVAYDCSLDASFYVASCRQIITSPSDEKILDSVKSFLREVRIPDPLEPESVQGGYTVLMKVNYPDTAVEECLTVFCGIPTPPPPEPSELS